MNSQAASIIIPTAFNILIANSRQTLGDSFNKSIKQVAHQRSNKFKTRIKINPESISLIENTLLISPESSATRP